jgi:hypothetical protein
MNSGFHTDIREGMSNVHSSDGSTHQNIDAVVEDGARGALRRIFHSQLHAFRSEDTTEAQH